jgi:hypothetical protein
MGWLSLTRKMKITRARETPPKLGRSKAINKTNKSEQKKEKKPNKETSHSNKFKMKSTQLRRMKIKIR